MNQGFTLTNFAVLLAGISVLAALSWPACGCQPYTKRTHVSEGLSLASAAKAAVAEYTEKNGAFPTTNGQAGIPATITGNAVSAVAVGPAGRITITYNAKVENGSTIVLAPATSAGGVTWTCSAGTVETKHRPSNCRQ